LSGDVYIERRPEIVSPKGSDFGLDDAVGSRKSAAPFLRVKNEMSKDDSQNYVCLSIKDLMADHQKCLACPGCGAEVEESEDLSGYECYDCDRHWDTYEVLESNL
jgi:hypothetical protein